MFTLADINISMSNELRHWMRLVEGDGPLRLYRGVSTVSRQGGRYFSPEKDFAMQFTQSAQADELLIVDVSAADIYRPSEPVYAGDPDAIDAVVAVAREHGYKAVWLDEGGNEPDSVYMFSIGAIKKVVQRPNSRPRDR